MTRDLILLLVAAAFAVAAISFLVWDYRQNQQATVVPVDAEDVPRRRRLEDLTPAEIRAVAARYNLRVTGKAGNTYGRILFYAFTGAVLFVAIGVLALMLLSWAPGWARLGVVIGGWVAVFFGILTPKIFTIEAPQLVGIKAMNFFSNRVHTYMPGTNICYPWDRFTRNDYLTLRSDVISEKSQFTTKDGIPIIFEKPSLRWRVFPPLLLLNASHSEETIKMGATDIFKTTLSNHIINEDMASLLNPDKLSEIQAGLIASLEGKTAHHLDAHGSTFEEQYGVVAEIPALGPPTLSEDYRQALEGKATMRLYKETAREIVDESHDAPGTPTMDFGHAFDNVMINAKENVKKDIFSVQMDQNTRDGLGDFGKSAGPILAAGAAALTGKNKTT